MQTTAQIHTKIREIAFEMEAIAETSSIINVPRDTINITPLEMEPCKQLLKIIQKIRKTAFEMEAIAKTSSVLSLI